MLRGARPPAFVRNDLRHKRSQKKGGPKEGIWPPSRSLPPSEEISPLTQAHRLASSHSPGNISATAACYPAERRRGRAARSAKRPQRAANCEAPSYDGGYVVGDCTTTTRRGRAFSLPVPPACRRPLPRSPPRLPPGNKPFPSECGLSSPRSDRGIRNAAGRLQLTRSGHRSTRSLSADRHNQPDQSLQRQRQPPSRSRDATLHQIECADEEDAGLNCGGGRGVI